MRLIPSLAILCAALAGCPSCEDICRNDLDCNPDEGKYVCVNSVCQTTLPEQTVDACTADGDCGDHQKCIDDACEFAPSCQFVADATTMAALVRQGATTTATTATIANAAGGCAFDVTVSTTPAVDVSVTSIEVRPNSAVGDIVSSCTGDGRWTSSGPGAYLVGCAGADIVLGPPGATLCFADDGDCPAGTACSIMPGFAAGDQGGFCE